MFLTCGANGHTIPMLPLVREFVKQGYTVDFGAPSNQKAIIQETGSRFIPYPEECSDLMTDFLKDIKPAKSLTDLLKYLFKFLSFLTESL